MMWNKDMSIAPTDKPVLLDLGKRGFAYAKWFKPWGVWIDPMSEPTDPENDEIYGIGSAVPLAWCEPVHAW